MAANTPGHRARSLPCKLASNNPAARLLMQEFGNLNKEKNEGYLVKLVREDNLFEWEVGIFGPPETIYAGGYFRATIKFPPEYPFAPPAVKFLSKLWHPNIYDNGSVCISILHPATNDTRSGELPCERWNPTQNAHSVIMSIISLLNEPNTNSPANVDASIMYRRWKEHGDLEYEKIVKDQAEATKADAEREGVTVPTTVLEYCIEKPPVLKKSSNEYNGDFMLFPEHSNAEDQAFTEFYGDDREEDPMETDANSPTK